MKGKRIIRIFVAVLAFVMMAGYAGPAYASVYPIKKVRVGYVISPLFQEGGEGEYKSGKGYEYLQKIAGYTGWSYEYVYGEFDELFSKLVDGKIDIMGNVSFTEERSKMVTFGRYEQGRESFCVYVPGKNSSLKADDFSTFDGKSFGVYTGTYEELLWKNWCELNGVQCKVVEYSSRDSLRNALNDGEIDAVLEGYLLEKSKGSENWNSILTFGTEPYYFAVNVRRSDLVNDLNKAQRKILTDEPYYNDDLDKRYMPNGIQLREQLDSSELSWLIEHDRIIKVGCLSEYLPISDVNDDGESYGVIPDVLNAIKDRLRSYKVKFEIYTYSDSEQMLSDLKEGVIDLAAPVYQDFWFADQKDICLTNPFMTTTMLLIQKGSYSAEKTKRIAIDAHSMIQETYAEVNYPDSERVLFSSLDDLVKAVSKGEVDSALSTACCYHVNAIRYKQLGEFNRATLPGTVNLSMAAAKGNPGLTSLINHGISSIDDSVVFNSLAYNSTVDKKVTIQDYIASNPGKTIMIVAGLGAVSAMIIMILIIIAIRLKKANLRASTDPMTGLLNKVSMREIAKEEMKRGGALFMIDIDNFKQINDALGHEKGDQVILHFSEALQKLFRSGDQICRFGGDEFLVFLPGSQISRELIEKKAEAMQEAILSCKELVGSKGNLTWSVSIGVLILEEGNTISYTEAFGKADDALYAAKNGGKNMHVITDVK